VRFPGNIWLLTFEGFGLISLVFRTQSISGRPTTYLPLEAISHFRFQQWRKLLLPRQGYAGSPLLPGVRRKVGMCGRRGPDAIGARAAYTSHPLPSTGPEKVCTPRISIAWKHTSVRLLHCCPEPSYRLTAECTQPRTRSPARRRESSSDRLDRHFLSCLAVSAPVVSQRTD
jgi:hypothetical protein